MQRAQSHIEKREYRGEEHGIYLARFLNRDREATSSILVEGSTTWQPFKHSVRPPTRATVRRIEELVELMRGMLAEFGSKSAHDTAWKALKRRLGQYRFRVFANAVGVPGRSATATPFYEPIGARVVEGEAIFSLFELSRIGQVDRLRHCAWCKKWFYARVEHQTHCPGGHCQKEEVRHGDKWKAYRREKANKYYWERKRGERK